MYKNAAVEIERIIKEDIGGRGLGEVTQAADLARAAEELYIGDRILILTGFCIAETKCGETDGPLGAVTLTSSLEKLGKKITIVTDEFSESIVAACARYMEIKARQEVLPKQGTEEFCRKLLDSFKPSHIVAIERPGKSRDGRFYSMRGLDLTGLIPDSDCIFEEANRRGILTIAIGDGGNELGMGKVRELVVESIDKGAEIAAAASADMVIVSGVSNWGAHGLEAMLSILEGRLLLNDAETERALVEEMVKAGAVDGCSKKREPTVDGLSLEQNIRILEKLHELIGDIMLSRK